MLCTLLTGSDGQHDVGVGSRSDRRKQPTTWWSAFRSGGRRVRQRRADDHRRPYYVDRFSKSAGFFALSLLTLSMVDAVATLLLLDLGAEEMNPAMKFLLGHGAQAFLLGKLALTAFALPVLLIGQNHYLFGTRFKVAYVLPMLVGLYATLNIYQLVLFTQV